MVLANYEIKALEHILIDYQSWINHVENHLKFDDPDVIIAKKVEVCLTKMISEYESVKGVLENLTDEEKVNFISVQPEYENRAEREGSLFA
jgi:hypothetical protein